MRSLNCSKQSMWKSKENKIAFAFPFLNSAAVSRAQSVADSSNATKFLSKNRVWNFLEDFFFLLKCNRKPTKWKFHLFQWISSTLRAWNLLVFLRFSFAFKQVRNIYPQAGLFSFAIFPYISPSIWLETYPAEKKVFEDFAWIFSHFSLALVIWRDSKRIVEMRRDQEQAARCYIFFIKAT